MSQAGMAAMKSTGRQDNFIFNLKPVIKELLRTEVCAPDLVLLVDRIYVVDLPNAKKRGTEGFKLYLSDGEKVIQAVLKHEIHPYLILGDVSEGSYVCLTKYELARSKKVSGKGNVAYLLIADLHCVGSEARDNSHQAFRRVDTADVVPKDGEEKKDRLRAEYDPVEPSMSTHCSSAASTTDVQCNQATSLANDDGGEETYLVEQTSISEKRKHSDSSSCSEEVDLLSPSRLSRIPLLRRQEISLTRDGKQLRPINRILKLMPLSRLSGSRALRNKICDVFVVICSVAPDIVKRSGMQAKRDLCIMDPSTDKRVCLSVFVDPCNFAPAVGTIALMRSVTTHEWDGGSLNVYPKECEDREWFIPDPVGIEGCDVEGLRGWWQKKQGI